MYLLIELMFFFPSILPLWTPVLLFGNIFIWKFIATLGLISSCEEYGFLRVIPKTDAWKLLSLGNAMTDLDLQQLRPPRN